MPLPANKWTFSLATGVSFYLAFIALMVYFLFYNNFAFNYESYLNQQYLLVFWLPVLAILLIWLCCCPQEHSYALTIGLLSIALVSCLLFSSDYYSFANEYFFTICIIAAACYGIVLLKQTKLLPAIAFAFITLFILQLYFGITQQFDIETQSNLLIKGSLQNSGVYAYYLVFNLPFFHWFCFNGSKYLSGDKNRQLINYSLKTAFVLLLVIVCYLIYATQSRTAMISLGVTIIYFLFSNYKTSVLAALTVLPSGILWLLGAIGLCSISYAGIWLFNLKKMSAIGRLLSFDIAWQHIGDHFWLGTGIGRFTWYYPQWQAAYFTTNSKPTLSYFFSAGESYIIFNEYLQLFETLGLPGFLLCAYGLYRFFKITAPKNQQLLLAVKCTVIAILSSGFTSYPLHVNIIVLLLGTCLAMGFSLGESQASQLETKKWVYVNKTLALLGLFIVVFTFYKGYLAHNALTNWAAIRSTGGPDTPSNYEKLYPALKNDGKFLTEYGTSLLSNASERKKAIKILERAKQFAITRQSIQSLITAYNNSKKYDAVILNQQFLTHYLPNKFLPRYHLLQTYQLQKDTANVIKTAKTILQMPVKIPSLQVEKIKTNTQLILKEHFTLFKSAH